MFGWFHKGLGIVYLTAIFPLFFQIEALLGSDGLMPADILVARSYSHQGIIKSFLQFPSLFHFFPTDAMLYVLVLLGCIGGLMLVLGYRIFTGGVLAWLSFLSITSIGGDFFVIIIDLFLAEVGFLAIFSTYHLEKHGQIPKVIGLAFQVLNFRLWFCMGVNKFYMPLDVWTDFSFFDYYFHAQPMPSALAPLFDSSPKALKTLAHIGLFIAELIVPFFVFAGKYLRLFAFYCFVLISVLIQISGNFGYFNILSIVIGILILKDKDLHLPVLHSGGGLTNDKKPMFWMTKGLISYQILLQVIYCFYVFHPKPYSYQNHFNYLFTPKSLDSGSNNFVVNVFKWPEYWRICNPYGVFKGIPYKHLEIRLSGSTDSINWKPYKFRYLPSGLTDYLGFYAPFYPRLDHLFFYETIATQNYKWNPLNKFNTVQNTWYCNFMEKLLVNDRQVSKLLLENPFKDGNPPDFVKAEVFALRFSETKKRNLESDSTGSCKIYTRTNFCRAPLLTEQEAMKLIYSDEE